MKLADLRAKMRARPLRRPEHFELPPEMTRELWDMLIQVAARALGMKPLKGSREHRLLGCLERLEMVILSANGYYMIRDKGRQALQERREQAAK